LNELKAALGRIKQDLDASRVPWALIGGLALAALAEARMTRDIDVVMAVGSDREADVVTRNLLDRGYRMSREGLRLRKEDGSLAMVRLLPPGETDQGVILDLFFNWSGIEAEIARGAERLEVFRGLSVPVARLGHMLALKVSAGRDRDIEDARHLLREANPPELTRAREALAWIAARGVTDREDLSAALEQLLQESPPALP
jgi:hypothetical protein